MDVRGRCATGATRTRQANRTDARRGPTGYAFGGGYNGAVCPCGDTLSFFDELAPALVRVARCCRRDESADQQRSQSHANLEAIGANWVCDARPTDSFYDWFSLYSSSTWCSNATLLDEAASVTVQLDGASFVRRVKPAASLRMALCVSEGKRGGGGGDRLCSLTDDATPSQRQRRSGARRGAAPGAPDVCV